MEEVVRLPIQVVDEYSGQLRALQESFKNIKQPDSVKNLSQTFDKIKESAHNLTSFLETGVKAALSGVGIGAFSVTAGISAIAASSLSFGSTIVGLKRVSDETGISIQKLNLLTKAAGKFGVSSETIAPSIKKLTENLRDLSYGYGSLPALNNVKGGPELLARLKKAKTVDEANQIALDAIANTKDNVSKRRLSAILYGNEEMANFGLRGKAAMDKTLSNTGQDIRQIKPDDIKNAEALTKAVGSVKESFQALKEGLGSVLMPTIAELASKLKDFINGNREFLEGKFKEAVGAVINFVKDINWKELGNQIQNFYQAVKDVVKFIGWLLPEKSQYTKSLESVPDKIREAIEKQHPGGSWEYDPRQKESRYRFKDEGAHWYEGSKTLYPSDVIRSQQQPGGVWSDEYDKKSGSVRRFYKFNNQNEDEQNNGLLHRSSYRFGEDADPFGQQKLLQNIALKNIGVGGANSAATTGESSAQRIIKQGVFEALLLFKQWLEVSANEANNFGGNSSGYGNGGGVQKASYTPGRNGGYDAEVPHVSGKTVARGSLAKNQKEAYAALRDEGLSHEDAKTLVGNISGESLANPADYHWDKSHMAQGIVQWDNRRSADIKRQFGKEPRFMSVREQVRAMMWEIKNKYKKTWAAINDKSLSPEKKMSVIVRDYERPGNAEQAIRQRLQHRNGLKVDGQEEQLRQAAPEKKKTPASSNFIQAAFNGANANRDVNGSLDIRLMGFPKGTQTKTDMKDLFRKVEITKARPMVESSMEI